MVLDKGYNLRVKNTLSHCAVLDIPGYHKLLNFTDGGMVIRPDGSQKLEILENAVLVARALGLSPVKVAVSGAVAHASEKMPHTLADTETLIPTAREKFDDIAIQGPLPLDLATDKASAQRCHLNGPVVADADIFLVLRLFNAEMKEVVFQGALDPHTPIAQGWLRASHRKLDPELSTEYRPYHSHDVVQPLEPGEVYELDVEVWPSCIVAPAGYRLALSVRGRDYEYPGGGAKLHYFRGMKGCGPFLHDHPKDRPEGVFGGRVTIYGGGNRASYLLLPVIPPK